MSDEQPLVIDRKGWPPGPWDDEPDREHFVDESTGLDCLIVRNRMGALCGYVGVPVGHQFHGKDYNDVDVEVHGGLTYANECAGAICHSPEEAANEPVWWLGFDCAHAGDECPSSLGRWGANPYDTYRTIKYVRGQCRSLARQVKAAT